LTTRMFADPSAATRVAGTAAVNNVPLPNVVCNADPFHWTVEPAQKYAPPTDRLNPPEPALTVGGVRLEIDGPGGSIAKVNVFETPTAQPVALGFTTRTGADPGAAIRFAGTAALNAVELLNVVVSAVPLHWTVDWAQKFAPDTDSVNAALPAVALWGDN